MSKQYWADAATANCVWVVLQQQGIGFARTWWPTSVWLTRTEAENEGNKKGVKDKDWKIFGVPCDGIMAKILSQHAKEFEDKVEYISVTKGD